MTPEEKRIYNTLEKVRIRAPVWERFRERKFTEEDPYAFAGIPISPVGMLDDTPLHEIEHTPADVLMFTSDITPAWYSSITYPGAAFQELGRKELTDREYRAYLRCAQRDHPIEESPVGLWDYSEHMVYDVTAKGFGGFKVAHEIRKAGYTCQVIGHHFYATEQDFQKIFYKFVGENTRAVCFSTVFSGISNPHGLVHSLYFMPGRQKKIKQWIRERNPDTKMILGGAIGPALKKETIEMSDSPIGDIDIVNNGYGDVTITEILEDIDNKKRVNFYTDVGSRLDITNSTMQYTPEDCLQTNDMLTMETARGCIFECSFCNFGLTGKEKGSYLRSQSLLEDEIKRNWYEHGVHRYWMTDDTFNDDTEKIIKIAKLKEKLDIPLEYTAFIRLDLQNRLKQEQVLIDSGLVFAHYGIETLIPDSAVAINKGWHPDEQMAYIADLQDTPFGDQVTLFSMFMVGLPEDSKKELKIMADKICDPNYNKLDCLDVNAYTMNAPESSRVKQITGGKESPIVEDPEKYGYKFSRINPQSKHLPQDELAHNFSSYINRHGITHMTAMRFALQTTMRYFDSKGYIPRQMMSGGYFKKEAVHTPTGENYLRKYWNLVGQVSSHTKYDKVIYVDGVNTLHGTTTQTSNSTD